MIRKSWFNKWGIILFGSLITLQLSLPVFAQEMQFNQRQMSVIHLEAKKIIEQYGQLINQLGETILQAPDQTKAIREQFLGLFVSHQVMVFNDLDPEYNLSTTYEAETYINNLVLSYPDGIRVVLRMDQVKVGEILSHGKNRFSIDFILNKQIYGNYRDIQMNTNFENLLFRVGFTRADGNYQNFNILGIQNVDSELTNSFDKSIEDLNAEKMKQNETNEIEQGIISLLRDYSNYISLIVSDKETDFDKIHFSNSFKGIFESPEVLLYNDLQPDPSEGFVSIDAYLDLLRSHYPAGFTKYSLSQDSAFSSVISEDNDQYYVSIGTDKFISGEYDNQLTFRKMVPLKFKISFVKKNKAFEEFRIRSIDYEGEDIYTIDESYVLPSMDINPVTRKGFSLFLNGFYGPTLLWDRTLLEMDTNEHPYQYQADFGYGAGLGLGIQASVSDHVAFNVGFSISQYSTTFSLHGEYEDTYVSDDLNGDSFFRVMQIDYDSTLTINEMSIPVEIHFITSNPGKTGFYFTMGAMISYCNSIDYKTEGSWDYFGHYPNNPTVIQELRIEELGFFDDRSLDSQRSFKGGQLHYSGSVSFGLSIPIKYFTQIIIGPKIDMGFTDFNIDEKERSDLFGKTITHQPAYLIRAGINLGIIVKL